MQMRTTSDCQFHTWCYGSNALFWNKGSFETAHLLWPKSQVLAMQTLKGTELWLTDRIRKVQGVMHAIRTYWDLTWFVGLSQKTCKKKTLQASGLDGWSFMDWYTSEDANAFNFQIYVCMLWLRLIETSFALHHDQYPGFTYFFWTHLIVSTMFCSSFFQI